MSIQRVKIVDSHTAGEPTRVVVDGGPDLGGGTVAEKRDVFRARWDDFRSAVIAEPRGSDVLVGALLTEPADETCAAGVVFFNNIGFLGMCGHGTIGVIATLAHLKCIGPGAHRLETPVGVVTARLHELGDVSVRNVPAYRLATGVFVAVPGIGPVMGDIAWGGNWFFLVSGHAHELSRANVAALTEFTQQVKKALADQNITGADGAEIDHIELLDGNRNFVLCPGGAYDRSPCGTGTSAKLACLYADGKLAEGEVYEQRGILGTSFAGSVKIVSGQIVPTITGRAFVTAEATLILDDADPFCRGIRL